ncbi:DUF402 domain-containing protein [Corynebacterium caspium]|uniref:DUF402 domain-containing protein n=1 Tax=Corynebacterium caspium TaxID=234828 RepID=UPI0003631F56|nr:DUF402 domain-containing protein [Corynebacterium caspium]WKD59522.1 hypothetical protein CCASP_05675 [Corynebacterium caspium DSM 44850]
MVDAHNLHPVKEELFDTATYTNTDPKGFLREVDVYKVTDFGLYMARGSDHPRFGYLESWLLPSVGLRANIFHNRPGQTTGLQDFYFDVADITIDGTTWHTRDLYVDLISNTGTPIEVLDIDELSAATAAHLITADDAERAINITLRAVEGITRHHDDPMEWLAKLGYPLTWAAKNDIELTPNGSNSSNDTRSQLP